MTTVRLRACVAVAAVVLAGHPGLAQEAGTPPVAASTGEEAAAEAGTNPWSLSALALLYVVPDANDFVSPVVTADRGWLHLEARYNYENFRTASIWFGYNGSVGETLVLDFTLMLGGVLGDTAGVAPGYRFSLTYGKLELTSESEYVFDARASADSFFYNWSELSVSPLEGLRAGVVVQRTRLYGEDRDVQRGFLAGFSYGKANVTAYLFNPDASKPTFVLALGLDF